VLREAPLILTVRFVGSIVCRYGGEGGIRTHGRVSPTLAFEASSFDRSDTSPRGKGLRLTDASPPLNPARVNSRKCSQPRLTTSSKKILKKRGAFFRAHIWHELDAVIQLRIIKDIEATPRRAALGIVRAVNHAIDSRLHDRASAHRTWFDGDVERDARQPVISNCLCRGAERDHFRVRRWIAIANRAIGTRRDFAPLENSDGANRHFAGISRAPRLIERDAHPPEIGFDCGGHVRWKRETGKLKMESRKGARLMVVAALGWSSGENKMWRARLEDRSATSFASTLFLSDVSRRRRYQQIAKA